MCFVGGIFLQPKHDVEQIKLSATEIGAIWTLYVNNSMSIQVLSYFLSKVDDNQIREILDYAYNAAKYENDSIIDIFNAEGQPIPHGFTENDVNLDAPRLFSDNFFLQYVKNMALFGVTALGTNYSMASRSDVRNFFRRLPSKGIKT